MPLVERPHAWRRTTASIADYPAAVTDSHGRFAFINVAASAGWAINASHAGYLTGGFSAGDVPGTSLQPIPLAEGQRITDVRVPLWRPGAIGGVLRDERGEPVVGVQVAAIGVLRFAGRDRLAGGPVTLTDDRGAYRLANLPPGRYQLRALNPPGSVEFQPTSLNLKKRETATVRVRLLKS